MNMGKLPVLPTLEINSEYDRCRPPEMKCKVSLKAFPIQSFKRIHSSISIMTPFFVPFVLNERKTGAKQCAAPFNLNKTILN